MATAEELKELAQQIPTATEYETTVIRDKVDVLREINELLN